MFKIWLESTFTDLYQSAVDAFPHTTKRQHATGEVQIHEMSWLPFIGMRTLLLRALAINETSGTHYRPIILFKNVQYSNEGSDLIDIVSSDNGLKYRLKRLSEDRDVLLRCQCQDYAWRFIHWNALDKSNYGRDRKPYEAISNRGPINPTESPGMCKHLLRLMEVLRAARLV